MVVIDGLSVFGGMKARFTPEGGTGTASGLKTQGLAPQACSWLFGFSPEGGTRTAGVRKPPESGPPLTPKALRAEDPEAGARDRWLTHTGRDMSPSGLEDPEAIAQDRWLTHTGRDMSPSGLEDPEAIASSLLLAVWF